jgi:hypothetical protein
MTLDKREILEMPDSCHRILGAALWRPGVPPSLTQGGKILQFVTYLEDFQARLPHNSSGSLNGGHRKAHPEEARHGSLQTRFP